MHPLAFALLLAVSPAPTDVTLERIMAAPEWMGRFPGRPRWTVDGRTILFERSGGEGCAEQELVALGADDGSQRVVADDEVGRHVPWDGWVGSDSGLAVSLRDGDVVVTDLETLRSRQLTGTSEAETSPLVLRGGRAVAFGRGDAIVVRDLATGLERQLADLRAEDEPGKPPNEGRLLHDDQLRLFDHVRQERDAAETQRQRARERALADPARPPAPIYLGKDVKPSSSHLSPDGRWMLVVAGGKESDDWPKGIMPDWVTASGQVETHSVRAKVGAGKHESPKLLLLDLAAGTHRELDLATLPGITEDPLAALRARAAERAKQQGPKAEGEDRKKDEKPSDTKRHVGFQHAAWSPDGRRLAVQLRSADNKDRWIAEVDLAEGRLVPLHRLTDPAWISWDLNDMGWLPDGSALWFLSEETGWSQLMLCRSAAARARPLTRGRQVVTSPEASRDGRWIWFLANPGNPGVREVWRVEIATGVSEQVTRLGGLNEFRLSPDESRLLILHSEATLPPEIFVQDAWPGGEPRRLTDSRSDAFRSIAWTEPRFVDVPSRHGAAPIHARLYLPEGEPPAGGWPAIFFIHGAGYLQDAHAGWSSYFREFMFATLLARAGYVVMDPDYRASAGYGRAWRTAIHRNMGRPEVDDLADCISWLAETQRVDPRRVGAWGGSYGGFLVLQTMFTRPDLLACGAALRPVTDWAHYNHPYTSRILETPELAPEAYRSSSPIEHARGLSRPLLICAPMQDDNVFFQDSVRLAQRLIELEKQDWEIAVYPVEPHGFREPASWLDEYRRIRKLFRTTLGR